MLWNQRLTLNRLFLQIVFLGTMALIVSGAILLRHEQQKAARQWQSDTISKSASLTSSYYSILNTKLLMGHEKDVARLLLRLKREEELVATSIISSEHLNQSVLETCKIDYAHAYFFQVPTCYEVTKNSLIIYHELRSVGYSIGYLLKEVRIPPHRFWNSTLMLWHVGCVLLVFLFVIMLVLFYVRRHLIQPLNGIGEALKNNRCLPGSNMYFKVDELQSIYESLKNSIQSVAEYERKMQKYEYDAKMGEAASQVAHDIRSPLSSLQAALMLLREQCGDNENIQDPLNLLQLSSKRLNDIANGLLAKHKGEESQAQFFSIHEILDELVGELQASPLGQGTEFKKHYHADALYVSGDKTGLTRALGNIVKNALEAMQGNSAETPKQLTFTTTCHPEAKPKNDNVVIRITDTGPGIPADKIPLILQGGHTEGKADGHGIGTKVVHDVVTAHDGHLAIESEVGVGTSFIMTLPAVDVGGDHNETTTITIPHAAGNSVYVIDDDAGLREQWRLTLKAQGVVPTIYTCWEEYAGDSSPLAQNDSTFIIDYHFDNSEVDGLEIIRRLKARGYSHFVLATAEYWKPAIKDTALKLGAMLCPKPLPRVVVQQRHLEGAVIVSDAVILNAVKDLDPSPTAQDDKAEPQDDKVVPRNDAAPHTDKVGTTVLLIDDGEEIRLTWLALKKHLGIATLHSFPSLEAAILARVDPSQCDLCVIDKNIDGSQYDGARMLEYLKQNGAKTVVLATGELESDIRNDPQFDTIDGIIADKIPRSLDEYLHITA